MASSSSRRESGEASSGKGDPVEQWIVEARAGCPGALANLVELCRQYLLLVANRALDGRIRSKTGASDLVQETLLAAQQSMGSFQGRSEGELRLWLKRILLHKVATTSRSFLRTAKRDVRREQDLNGLSDSDGARQLIAVDDAPTPQRRAVVQEEILALHERLGRLPEHYREIIQLRSFERKSFVEIGAESGISADAARKRWCLAVKYLRDQWTMDDESR